jgi:DNA topoisomerase I
MGKALIIVESPAKIKTLQKFLGPNYLFESSLGHIRDLPEKSFGIDVEGDFEPAYEILSEKKQVIDRLVKAAKQADVVYLCPDPDREGEAIAWHIAAILPEGTNYKRTAFHSITKSEVLKALEHPEEISIALVNAQQARRLLDRIVGYKISPILARKVMGGRREGRSLSAGRVQSVALKLVVDREKEIEKFLPVEYWTLGATLDKEKSKHPFRATLFTIDGKRVEKEPVEGKEVALVPDEKTATQLAKQLKGATYEVSEVVRKEKRRHPVAPFITSTLQQEASRHFRFSTSRTMKTAQTLYEGVDLGAEGPEGLITYMRTDSVRTAPEAVHGVRDYILSHYGQEYLPEKPNLYKAKKSAQDAHEAIRPTNLNHPPDLIKSYLTRDQLQLYTLIWNRFVASQMASAIYDTVTVDIATDTPLALRATGNTLKFKGFLAVYEEKQDEDDGENGSKILPHVETGDKLKLLEVHSDQSFTRPPPRFSEASLVKELEKSGIGRPSTYAAIMAKIQGREYTVKEQGRLKPTELGCVIAELLEKSFPQIMNIGFTAAMEDDLEAIAQDEKDWKELIRSFWKDFIPTVEVAEKEAFVPRVETDLPCPKCGSPLQKIWARSKYFYGCSRYPDCDYSAPLEELSFNKEDYDPNFDWDQKCPVCGSEMKIRHGRYGPFLGCTNYPDCKGAVNIPKKGEQIPSVEEMPACPAIGCDGRLMARRSRFGKIFFSCTNFPDCDVIVNELNQLETKYVDHPKTPYVKKERKKGGAKSKKTKATKGAAKEETTKRTRTTPPRKLSPELAKFLGVKELTRGDVIRQIWDYIKSNNLQDPKDKRVIRPDEKLGELLGTHEPIPMFQLSGLLSKHLKG